LILAAIGLGLVILFWWQARRANQRADQVTVWTRAVMDSLSRPVTFPMPPEGSEGRDSLYWQWAALSAQLQSRRWQQSVRYWASKRATLLSDPEIAALRNEGLSDPIHQLRDSLAAHPSLIPFKPALGGRMQFLQGEVGPGIVLLERPYVFAYFADGQSGGHMLLTYQILPGPRVRWRVMWAARD
jgi:hypothetical protein